MVLLCLLFRTPVAASAVDLPVSLTRMVADEEPRFVVRYRWSELGGAPVFVRLDELRQKGVPEGFASVVDVLLPAVLIRLGDLIPAREVEEAWIATDDLRSMAPRGLWLRVRVDPDQLLLRLEGADWFVVSEAPRTLLARHRDPVEDARSLEALARFDSAQRAFKTPLMFLSNERLAVLPGGWLELAVEHRELHSRRDSPTGEPSQEVNPEVEHLLAPLCELGPRTVVGVAMRPHQQESMQERPVELGPDPTLDDVYAAMRELDAATGRALEARFCGLVLTLSETDGGFRIGVRGSCPGRVEAETTAAMLDMFRILARLTAITLSPNLAMELGSGAVLASSDGVAGEVSLSAASVLEAIEAGAARSQQRRRLEALRDELLRKAARERATRP